MAMISLRQLLDHAAENDYGVPAFNINNMERVLAITGQMRKLAHEKPAEFDPRKFALPGWAAMRELCRDRFERFGAAGQASKIRVIPLARMAERYRNHELDPTIGGQHRAA